MARTVPGAVRPLDLSSSRAPSSARRWRSPTRCCAWRASRDDNGPLLIARRALTNTEFFTGDLGAARSHAETVLATYQPARHGALAQLYSADPYVVSAFFLAHTLARMGYRERRGHGPMPGSPGRACWRTA